MIQRHETSQTTACGKVTMVVTVILACVLWCGCGKQPPTGGTALTRTDPSTNASDAAEPVGDHHAYAPPAPASLASNEIAFLSSPPGQDVYLVPDGYTLSNSVLHSLEQLEYIGKTPTKKAVFPGQHRTVFVEKGDRYERTAFKVFNAPGGGNLAYMYGACIVEQEGASIRIRSTDPDSDVIGMTVTIMDFNEIAQGMQIPVINDGLKKLSIELNTNSVTRLARSYEIHKPVDAPAIASSLAAPLGTAIEQVQGIGGHFEVLQPEITKAVGLFQNDASHRNAILDTLCETGVFAFSNVTGRTLGPELPVSPDAPYVVILRLSEGPNGSVTVHQNLLDPTAALLVSRTRDIDIEDDCPLGACTSLSFSPNASKLLWTVKGGELWQWDVTSNKFDYAASSFKGDLNRASWNGNDVFLSFGNSALRLWDAERRKLTTTLPSSSTIYDRSARRRIWLADTNGLALGEIASGNITTNSIIRFSTKASLFPRTFSRYFSVIEGDGSYQILRAADLTPVASGTLQKGVDIRAACELEDRIRVVLSTTPLSVWDLPIAQGVPPSEVAQLSDRIRSYQRCQLAGDIVVGGSPPLVYDLRAGATNGCAVELAGSQHITALALSADGGRLAAAGNDQTVSIFDTADLAAPLRVIGVPLVAGKATHVKRTEQARMDAGALGASLQTHLSAAPGNKYLFRQSVPSDRAIYGRSVGCSFSIDAPDTVRVRFKNMKWKNSKLWYDLEVMPLGDATNNTAFTVSYTFSINADDPFTLEDVDTYVLRFHTREPSRCPDPDKKM